MYLSRLAEIRLDLESLSHRPIGPSVISSLRLALNNLRIIREKWLTPEPKPIVVKLIETVLEDVPVFANLPVYESNAEDDQEQEDLILPVTVSQSARSALTTSTYNSELILPYKVLWAKVIIRAAYDYALWKDSNDIRLRRFAEDAAKWLFEPSDSELELSFENICFAFDFPIEKIRKKTRSLTREDVKKLEFRERQGKSELLGEFSGGNHK